MKGDVVLVGVGGQGVLSAAGIIAEAAFAEGYAVKQSEVHGMAQRGGSVIAHVRIADEPIAAPTVPLASADLVLGMEVVEGLRALPYLAADGWLVTAGTRVETAAGYPTADEVSAALDALDRRLVVDAAVIARESGSLRCVAVVMIGAALSLLPIRRRSVEARIRARFAAKGDSVVETNLRALDAGLCSTTEEVVPSEGALGRRR